MAGKPITAYSLDEQRARFRGHTEIVLPSDCWLWTSQFMSKGYGYAVVAQKRILAHRRSYELFVGPIPAGLDILHSCDTPACVNPDHLRPGTDADNGADMSKRKRAHFSRATQCAKGHPFDEENTAYSTQRGRTRRHCRICRRAAQRRHNGFTGQGRWPARAS